MHAPPFAPEFQRAFVAFRYFLGAREAELGKPLGDASGASALLERLAHPDRQKRAEALASELGRVVRALDAGNYR